jgi:hypothetical protein
LDRKRSFTVAACRDVPFGVDHDEAEASGVDPGQFGNIGCDLTPIRPLPHLVGYFPYDKVKVGQGVAGENRGCGSWILIELYFWRQTRKFAPYLISLDQLLRLARPGAIR